MRVEYYTGPDAPVHLWGGMLDDFSDKMVRRFGRSTWSRKRVVEGVKSGDLGVWAVSEHDSPIALVVSRVVYYGVGDDASGPWLEVPILVGERFDEWIDGILMNLLLYVGQLNLCGIRAICRPGMHRWLEKFEFYRNDKFTEWANGQRRRTDFDDHFDECAA